jgi:redox-sensitive bicupin YhaK (pirin superfamily)
MVLKIDNSQKQGHGPIKILYPGLGLNNNDSGIGSIGRIDHAHVSGGTLIPMHPHINDEILSYFRSGKVLHKDSEGLTEYITPNRLMLMKAGKQFFHEEKVMEDGGSIEGLQIFIRPQKKDLTPQVDFYELKEKHSLNQWRLIASPENENGLLKLRSQTWIFDIKITQNNQIILPELANPNLTMLLYFFRGKGIVSNAELLSGDSLIIQHEKITIHSNDAELILFVTDETADIYKYGMYSGNKMNKKS